LTLLVGRQEGHPACKKTEWWGTGVAICLERDADLHMAQLMPLPLTVSVRLVLPFWFRLTRVVPDKGPLNGCVCRPASVRRVWTGVPWACCAVCGHVRAARWSHCDSVCTSGSLYWARLTACSPSVLWLCWSGGRKGIRPVKTWVVECCMVICLERGADLHMAQLMPLPLIVSCFSKIQIDFTFLVPAHLGSPRKRPLNGCVCVTARCNDWCDAMKFSKSAV